MFFFGHRFGFLPWHNCQFEVLPMSLEDLLPMSSDHTYEDMLPSFGQRRHFLRLS
jgi:hypothetical protein